MAGAKARVLAMAVSKETLRMYEQKIQILADVAKQCKKRCIDEDTWYTFAEQFAKLSKDTQRSGLESFRSALVHAQQVGTVPGTWASSDACKRSCKAVMFRQGERKICPRGALETPDFEALLQWLSDHGMVGMREFAVVLYRLYLRIEHLAGAKKEDVSPQGFRIPNKGYRLATMETQTPWITYARNEIPEDAWEILQRRAAVTGDKSSLLFPCSEFRIATFRRTLRTAAHELQWDPKLVVDVPHAFRHGGAQALVERGGVPKMSASSKVRYLRPNGIRRERLQKAEAKKARATRAKKSSSRRSQ